ncbi:MAG TPA: DnaJ domain-containing protein [Usitatibacter sp.]|nr:DnaJ domain-containing protein [Usitatibacter sp.]
MAEIERTLYDVLGVKANAKMTEITRAYNRLQADQQKEDAAPNPRLLAQAKVAFETLSNPDKRDEYDAVLRRRALMGKNEKHKPIKIGVAAVAIIAALVVGYSMWHSRELAEEAKPKPLAPEALLAAVGPQLWNLQGALMSGEVRDLGTAIAVQDGKLVSTCEGLAAGMVVTAKSGDDSATAELANTNDTLDVCVFKAKGAKPGLKFRGDVPAPADKLQAVFVNAGGRPEMRQVSGARGVQDAQGPALEVKAAAPLPNGAAIFDDYGRLVGIVITPHAAPEGSTFALASRRIEQAKGTGVEKQFVEAPSPARNTEAAEPAPAAATGDPDKLRYTTRKDVEKAQADAMEKVLKDAK